MIIPLTNTQLDRLTGDRWIIEFLVADDANELVDETPVVTVTSPAGVVTTPTLERVCLGQYRLGLTVASEGFWKAEAAAVGRGLAVFNVLVKAITTTAGHPDVDACRDYANLGDEWTDGQIQSALNTELSQQRRRCKWSGNYPDDLAEALMRRVMVNLNWRDKAFSTEIGDAEIPVDLPGNDRIVRRLELPWRRWGMGW